MAAPSTTTSTPAVVAFPLALPDGGVLIVATTGRVGAVPSVIVTKLTGNGAIDRSWGRQGTATPGVRLSLLQVLRQPDGALLLVGSDTQGTGTSPLALKVARLRADGTLDASFADGGVARTAVGVGCGGCTTAALAPDGSIVVTGAIGSYTSNPSPTTVPDVRWSLTRVTPDGRVDTSFGTNGVATIPDVKASGFSVAVLPDGRIVTEGQIAGSGFSNDGVSILLARLTPSGAMDPAFGDGAPVRTPVFSGFPMLVREDGSVVIAGSEPGLVRPPFTPGRRLVVAYTPSGARDESFGTGGIVDVGPLDVQRLEPAPDRGMTVIATPWQTLMPGSGPPAGRFSVGRWSVSGPPDPAVAPAFGVVDIPFGGGGSSFVVSVRPRVLPPLGQNSFSGRTLTPRPDGSFLAVGGVRVSQPTGEGTGFSIGRTAVAAITPHLTLDPVFGGPAAPLTAAVAILRQRARTAYERHGIRVRLRASAPGLWRVKIRTRDGRRVLAQSVLPVFAAGVRTLPVELTATGNRWLRSHRRVRVTVSVTARDLFAAQATAGAAGTVR